MEVVAAEADVVEVAEEAAGDSGGGAVAEEDEGDSEEVGESLRRGAVEEDGDSAVDVEEVRI